ncbi:MAG: hypothetical protein R2825_10705 [Saprospiraceae bacterium]
MKNLIKLILLMLFLAPVFSAFPKRRNGSSWNWKMPPPPPLKKKPPLRIRQGEKAGRRRLTRSLIGREKADNTPAKRRRRRQKSSSMRAEGLEKGNAEKLESRKRQAKKATRWQTNPEGIGQSGQGPKESRKGQPRIGKSGKEMERSQRIERTINGSPASTRDRQLSFVHCPLGILTLFFDADNAGFYDFL